ncbi:hypothetical protein ACSQ67_000512 [Phaseolus vulgaris]
MDCDSCLNRALNHGEIAFGFHPNWFRSCNLHELSGKSIISRIKWVVLSILQQHVLVQWCYSVTAGPIPCFTCANAAEGVFCWTLAL